MTNGVPLMSFNWVAVGYIYSPSTLSVKNNNNNNILDGGSTRVNVLPTLVQQVGTLHLGCPMMSAHQTNSTKKSTAHTH